MLNVGNQSELSLRLKNVCSSALELSKSEKETKTIERLLHDFSIHAKAIGITTNVSRLNSTERLIRMIDLLNNVSCRNYPWVVAVSAMVVIADKWEDKLLQRYCSDWLNTLVLE